MIVVKGGVRHVKHEDNQGQPHDKLDGPEAVLQGCADFAASADAKNKQRQDSVVDDHGQTDAHDCQIGPALLAALGGDGVGHAISPLVKCESERSADNKSKSIPNACCNGRSKR